MGAFFSASSETEMKSAYALAFLGLCACVLVIHQNVDNSAEDTKQAVDPFLASIEAHVVAKAQRALRMRNMKDASHAHISEARKAIKASLLNAENLNFHEVNKANEEEREQELIATTTVKKSKKAPAKKKKTYTWAELQRGDDAVKEKHTDATDSKVGNLLQNLKTASHHTKAAPVQKKAKAQQASTSALKNALHAAKSNADDEEK